MLAVSDSAEELADLRHLLSGEYGRYLESHDEAGALNLFIKHHPAVLVLAFRSIEKAEQFYLTLYRRDERIHEVLHQTLLLCRSTESEQAYRLCKNGTIDDYVADRPLYDPFRLRLSVAQALKRHSQMRYVASLSADIADITDKLHQFDQLIGQRLAFGGGQHDGTIRAFQGFTRTIGSDLKGLEETLKGRRVGSGAGHDDIDEHFNAFRRNTLESGQERVLAQMKETGSVFKELEDGYQNYTQTFKQYAHSPDTPRVMLVDDDDAYREILATMLKDAGLQILEAGDGATALASLRLIKPDAILLDYRMPGMDGIATLQEIKANPETRDIPVVMLTGAGAREVVDQSVRAGARGFIVKPSDRKTILDKINAVIAQAGEARPRPPD